MLFSCTYLKNGQLVSVQYKVRNSIEGMKVAKSLGATVTWRIK